MGGNHRPHQGALPDIANLALARLQFIRRRGVNQITLADRRPVQAVRLVEDDFVGFRFARRALSGTQEDFDGLFPGRAVRVRDDYTRMRLLPFRRLPVIKLKGGSFLKGRKFGGRVFG